MTFNQLYGRYYTDIFKRAYKLTKDYDTASELTQTTFLRAHKYFYALQQTKNGHSWLIKILYSSYCLFLKQQQVQMPILLDDTEKYAPHQLLYRRYLHRLISDSVEQLNYQYRAIVSYRLLYNYSFKELATMYETTDNVIRMRYSRGLKKLRVIINKEI